MVWAVCLLLFPALAQTQTPVVTATQDTYLKQGTPNKNQGAETILSIRQSGSHRSLVLFNQTDIVNAVGSSALTSAKLRLTIVSNGNNWGSGGGVAVHRLTQSWTELGATWNCPDDINTSNGSPDCTQWDMDGTPQFPFLTTPTDVVLHQNGQQGVVEWNVTVDVAAFLAGTPNHGWVIKKADESESGLVEYSSREGMFAPELVLGLDGIPSPPPVVNPDTYLKKGTPNKNQGSETILRVQQSGPNRALVRFDQTEIVNRVGAGTLLSAKLRLTIASNGNNWGATGGEVGVHRMAQTWTEYGATWNCPDDINTSNSSADCTQWDMTGNTQFPFVVTPTATALQVNGQAGAVDWDVTADVQAFLGGTANHGWLIKKVEENQSGRMDYSSREGAFPPELVLDVSGGGVPGDTEPPTITATLTPEPNANGWNNTDVTVTFDCQDAGSGVADCPQPVVVTTEGLSQEFVRTATDQAGNAATTTVFVSLDKTAPTITPTLSPAPNTNGWNNSDVVVGFTTADALSGVATTTFPVILSTEGAGQLVEGSATDLAGNTASASTIVNLDKTPPSVTITSPTGSEVLRTPSVPVEGTFNEGLSGVSGATCNGVSASITGSSFSCSVALTDGVNAVSVQVTDLAGNIGSAGVNVTLVRAPRVIITSPTSLAVITASTIAVSGTLEGSANTVVVNGIPASVSGASFTVAGIPLHEGANTLTAIAADSFGNTGTASVIVVRDTTAPGVLIDFPPDGSTLTQPTVTVTGRLDDIAAATSRGEPVTVTVNGLAAQVANLTFAALDLPLQVGLNTLLVTARDAAGNSSSRTVSVTRQELAGRRITLAGGNNQSGVVGATLAIRLAISLTDSNGFPVPGGIVTFRVTRGDGTLSTPTQGGRILSVPSDGSGRAEVFFTLGSRTGAGNQRVAATAAGFAGEVLFCASALTGPPTGIKIVSGENQRGVVGQGLARPFIVFVHDAEGNPVGGVPVVFQVAEGGGNLDGSPSLTSATGLDGRTSAVLTLGPEAGINNNVVQANFAGIVDLPSVFIASGVIPGPPGQTSVSGVVLDNQNQPVEGVTASIAGTALQALSNAQGQFTLAGAPVGVQHLHIDGTTTTRPGLWASLEFELDVLPGVDNTVGMPIFLLPLDTENAKVVGGSEDVTLTLRDVPGFSMTVFANSATFPDGSRQGQVMVTQVHFDKVPMPPQEGIGPRLALTIQPAGVVFDPPARVTYPNVFGFKPGEVVNLFSFDHDLGEFVNVGTGSVSEDGSVFLSDPGVGIRKAGWHFPPPPTDPPTCAKTVGVRISPPTKLLGVDQIGALEALGSLQAPEPGCPALGGTFTWANSNPGAASGAEGVTGNTVSLTGVSPGTSLISVNYAVAGQAQPASAQVTVTRPKIVEVTNLDLRPRPDDPTNLASFIATRGQRIGDRITVRAEVEGAPGLNDKIQWEVNPRPAGGNITGPADPSTAVDTAEHTFKGSSLLATIGSRNANPAVEYEVVASLPIEGQAEPVRATRIVQQDVFDRMRQEYVDFGNTFQPKRTNVKALDQNLCQTQGAPPALNDGNYCPFIAEETGANLFALFENVQTAISGLLNDDTQVRNPGTTELMPDQVVVSPGANIVLVSAGNQVDLGTLGDTLPEGDDVCDNSLVAGVCHGNILAGPNGIADTVANNRGAQIDLLRAITSGYRNPRKNRAITDNTNSEHTTGHAIDVSRAALSDQLPVGLTLEQLVCVVELAGQRVTSQIGQGRAFFEDNFAGDPNPCNSRDLPGVGPHVHVEDITRN